MGGLENDPVESVTRTPNPLIIHICSLGSYTPMLRNNYHIILVRSLGAVQARALVWIWDAGTAPKTLASHKIAAPASALVWGLAFQGLGTP